jgi:CubicO group peptidase (beta-lactamase class C family)
MIRLKTQALGSIMATVMLLVGCSRPAPTDTAANHREAERDPAQIAEQIEATVPDLLEAGRIAGLSVCVLHEHEIAWCGSFGLRSAETGEPVDQQTVFQAASLSKPVFVYAVLQLVDEGVLNLDEPLLGLVEDRNAIEGFLGSEFDDPRVEAITARMVLTHSCGFPNWRRNGRLQIEFDPGARFSYSGEGFGLLQRVVEQLTGSSLEELVRAKVFQPLGMTDSTYINADVDYTNYGWPHDRTGAFVPKPADFEARLSRSRPHAAATLMTTALDYAQFLRSVASGTGLEKATWKDFLRPQSTVDEVGAVAWGLGVGLELGLDHSATWHWGDNGPTKAFFMVEPDSGNGLVYFANAHHGLGIVDDLVEIVLPGEHPALESRLMTGYPRYDSADFRLEAIVYGSETEEAISFVRGLQQEGEAVPVSEGVVNGLGYWLLQKDRLDDAIALFELNVELHPDAWNPYDSLGEALLKKGLREQGLANYRRSLELNPDNQTARRILAGEK